MRIGPRAGIALALAAGACGTRVEQVASGARDSRSAFARQVAMFRERRLRHESRARGASLRRDRSNVRHACMLMEERRENPGFDR